jgi:hypothetical protein
MLAQPAPPDDMVRAPAGHDRPETWSMTEHPEMCQLVDHDGFEGLRRGESQPPAEGQPAGPRGAPPPAPGIADRDGDRPNPQGRRVPLDGRLDLRTSTLAEPVPKDSIQGAAVAGRGSNDEQASAGIQEHGGPSGSGRCRDQGQGVVDATKPQASPGSERATCSVVGKLAGLAIEMTADPDLAFPDELRRDAATLAGGQAAAARDRHEHATPGIHDDPDPPRPRRAPQGVGEDAEGQGRLDRLLRERLHPPIVTDADPRRDEPAAVPAT